MRSPSRHTSQQLSTAAAGVAADVEVVPVAAAGDAVAGGRSSQWRKSRSPKMSNGGTVIGHVLPQIMSQIMLNYVTDSAV